MDPRPITAALVRAARGEPGAEEILWQLVCADLERLAAARVRSLPAGQTLQATALVHESWMRLGSGETPGFACRAQFFGAAARSMRNILVDQARAKGRQKHGGRPAAEELSTAVLASESGPDLDLLALDEAVGRADRVTTDTADSQDRRRSCRPTRCREISSRRA